MKILFVSSFNNGKITTIVKNQGDSLILSGCPVDFFGIKGRGLIGYLGNIKRLNKHIRLTSPDIIHAHYSLSGFAAALTKTKKPIVVSLMGSDTKAGIMWRNLICLFSLLRWDGVIVKSSLMKGHLGIKKAKIIPNGVNLDIFKPTERKKESSSRSKILFAADPGRKSKNYKLAKEAISRLRDENIILHILYSKPQDQIIDELNEADLLLSTSRWEGSPNIVKEAMACNCPVVSTNVGDVEWLFGNQPGYFLSGFDPADVAAKIKEALEFSRVTGKTNGRSRIIELSLDSRTVAMKLIQLYKEILEKRK